MPVTEVLVEVTGLRSDRNRAWPVLAQTLPGSKAGATGRRQYRG